MSRTSCRRPAGSWSRTKIFACTAVLCAERCPTGAWDMQKSDILIPHVKDEIEADQPKRVSAGGE